VQKTTPNKQQTNKQMNCFFLTFLSHFSQLLNTEEEPEAIFRVLVALGTLVDTFSILHILVSHLFFSRLWR
jgi:amino acid permease